MKYIIERIKQLECQLNDPEILDKYRIKIKLETYKECLQLVKNVETVKLREGCPKCGSKNVSIDKDSIFCYVCEKRYKAIERSY